MNLIILYRKETYNIGNHFSKAIMINSVQLMLYVHWLRTSWRRAGPIFSNIFSSRKMAALFENVGEREKQKRDYASLYKIFTNKFFKSYIAIGKWRHYSYLRLIPICVSCKLKQFSSSLVSFWHIQAIDIIITGFFFNLCRDIVVGHRTDLASAINTYPSGNIPWYGSAVVRSKRGFLKNVKTSASIDPCINS